MKMKLGLSKKWKPEFESPSLFIILIFFGICIFFLYLFPYPIFHFFLSLFLTSSLICSLTCKAVYRKLAMYISGEPIKLMT